MAENRVKNRNGTRSEDRAPFGVRVLRSGYGAVSTEMVTVLV